MASHNYGDALFKPFYSLMSSASVLRRSVQLASFFGVGTYAGWSIANEYERRQKYPNLTTVDLMEAVGNTPLIELKSLSRLTGCKIYGKAEYLNPGGSIKDRAAKYLILDAEAKGLLKPGSTIVEPTGGNTGISLALLAASRNYRTVFTMPKCIAKEKPELMTTLGATVHLQPLVPFSNPKNFYTRASALAKEIPGAYFPNQFENLANLKAHYETTGPEIVRQTGGKLDGFVCASGTGGTIAGISKYIKEVSPDTTVYLIDPEGGATAGYIQSGKSNSFWENGLEMIPKSEGSTVADGIGLNRISENFRHAEIDGAYLGTDDEMLRMAYFLLRHDGIFVGPSAALNAVGAVKLARQLKEQTKKDGHVIVTILCDGGDRYRSKIFNKEWLTKEKLQDVAQVKDTLDFIQ